MKFLATLLDVAGPHADKTAKLFWFFLSVETVVFVLILTFLFFSLWRRREPKLVAPLQPSAQTEWRLVCGVGISVALTVLILTSFVGASYAVDRELIDLDRDASVEIEVTAHQWWWELRYLSATPSEVFTTANEIHVPAGEKVRLILKSNDVIHSLWFPNLSGKRDIIPGRDQDLFIRADREGVWLGRCAEFCGMQHAKMNLVLFAEPKEKFEDWKRLQRAPATEPQTADLARGRQIFTSASCTLCHTIRGTEAAGYSSNAPDLTHLKSRTTIGAGAVQNTKGYLGGWILDPHGIKPGVHMPTILQEPQDFQALLSYLETLK
jgi:cytochrome c oxidase subunit 2